MESRAILEIENRLLYISFNYDYSYFTIGTEYGFEVYKSNPYKLISKRSKL